MDTAENTDAEKAPESEAELALADKVKTMQVDLECPITAYQTIVARTKGNPEYIVTLHRLFGTFVECVNGLKN